MKDKILRLELLDQKEESFVAEVLALMPVRIESTLNNFRVTLLGNLPKDRNSYDPTHALSTITGGEKVIVMDSLDLPPDWRDHDLADLMKTLDDRMEGDGRDGVDEV